MKSRSVANASSLIAIKKNPLVKGWVCGVVREKCREAEVRKLCVFSL